MKTTEREDIVSRKVFFDEITLLRTYTEEEKYNILDDDDDDALIVR
jgi:hypothetical protein